MKRGDDLLKMLSTMYASGLKLKAPDSSEHRLDRERKYVFRDPKNMMPLYGVGGLRDS